MLDLNKIVESRKYSGNFKFIMKIQHSFIIGVFFFLIYVAKTTWQISMNVKKA